MTSLQKVVLPEMTPSHKIVAIGEVLWDLLPNGAKPGGAPANFAYHAQCLGAASSLISAVGTDKLGHDLLAFFQSIGLSTDLVQHCENSPTGTVGVVIDEKGVPTFTIHENVAWDFIRCSEENLNCVNQADAVCFGSLASRCVTSQESIRKMLQHCSQEALRVLDLNLRAPFYSREMILQRLELANVLKLNDEELLLLVNLLDIPGEGLKEQAKWLLRRFDYRLLIVTRGPNGSLLLCENDVSDHPGFPVEHSAIADTVGAGDAFTAAAILGFLDSTRLEQINEEANEYAGYICTQAGATPTVPEKYRTRQKAGIGQ
ncbi:MAG: carbohydrate kinase family protein [Thermoguttaceae bacterium]